MFYSSSIRKNIHLKYLFRRDFQEIDDNLLAPILEALKPLADIRVESQVMLKLISLSPCFVFN